MKRYRAGIIGCGKIGSEFADDPKMQGDIFSHAEAYTACTETELAAICDLDPEKLAKCGERWGVQAQYSDVEEMLNNESLEIVSVCTPDETHYQVVREILSFSQSVKVILCEKPLATSVHEAEEMVSLARKKNIILTVVYMRRYAQNYKNCRDFIQSGKLGQVQAVSGWYTKGVKHNGTHWFDSLRFLVGEIDWVRAWKRINDNENDPTLDVILGLVDGTIASLRACDANYFTIFDMEIMGSLGRVRLLDSGYNIEYSKVVESRRYSEYKELEITQISFGDRKDLMLHAVEDGVNVIRTGKSASCSGEDGALAIKIAEAAITSAQRGEVIQIK